MWQLLALVVRAGSGSNLHAAMAWQRWRICTSAAVERRAEAGVAWLPQKNGLASCKSLGEFSPHFREFDLCAVSRRLRELQIGVGLALIAVRRKEAKTAPFRPPKLL